MAVLDLDISNKYPSNFVCILPKDLSSNSKSLFQTKFKEQSSDIAKQLLTKALAKEEDKEIKKEILTRLNILNPKPKNMVKCLRCGKGFYPRRFGYAKQKTCNECWRKARAEEDYNGNFYYSNWL